MRKCRLCTQELTEANQQPSCGRICRDCFREYSRIHNRKKYSKEPERFRKSQREYTKRIKEEVIGHYSPTLTCAKCGFDDIRALSIDHIDGGGVQHRKEIKRSSGKDFYQWLKSSDYPNNFQVLCMNCQFIKRYENDEVRRSFPTR